MKKIVLCLSLIFLGIGIMTYTFISDKKPINEKVSKPVLESIIPVSTSSELIRPYKDSSVSIISNYYEYKDDFDRQISSIIYFDNTYMQNTGVIYGTDHEFDILSIADGEVIKITEDDFSGKVVEVAHNNEVISKYKLLSDVKVSLNTKIKKGDVIGKSGLSNIGDIDKNQLFFELVIKGELVNPENYFGKSLEEI